MQARQSIVASRRRWCSERGQLASAAASGTLPALPACGAAPTPGHQAPPRPPQPVHSSELPSKTAQAGAGQLPAAARRSVVLRGRAAQQGAEGKAV